MIRFVVLFILVCISLSSLASTLNASLLSQGYKAIPLRQAAGENILLADISFGSEQYHTFIVDTGAAFTSIDPSIVQEEGFELQNKHINASGADSHHHQSQEVIIPKLVLGNLVSRNNIAFTENSSFIRIDDGPIAGKIGLDFLRDHAAILDVANQRLYLKSASTVQTNNSTFKELKTNYKQMQLERAPSGHQVIQVNINGTGPTRFMLDSGMPHSMVSLDYAKNIGLKINNRSIVYGQGSGGGKLKIYRTNINEFSVNSLSYDMHNVGVMDFHFIQVGVPLSGCAGLDWLQESHAIMDLRNDVVLIRL